MKNAIVTILIVAVLFFAINKMFGDKKKKKNKNAMNIKIVRKIFTEKSTIGEMYIDGKFFCYTLEDKVRSKKIMGETAIPYGSYDTIIDHSTRFKKQMPHLLNVPGFEGIRIHNGNTSENTDGCILLGSTKSKDFVGNSVATFQSFMKVLTAYFTNNPKAEVIVEITK